MAAMVLDGRIKHQETWCRFEHAPDALNLLFTGGNHGKPRGRRESVDDVARTRIDGYASPRRRRGPVVAATVAANPPRLPQRDQKVVI